MEKRNIKDIKKELVNAYSIIVPTVGLIVARTGALYSIGTGFVCTARGGIVTCNHILKGGNGEEPEEIRANFLGVEYEIKIKERFPLYDIALCEAKGTGLPEPVSIHEGEPVPVGHDIAGLGFPFATNEEEEEDTLATIAGYPSLTRGVVSSLIPHRFTEGVDIYQVDFMHVGGSSGGPVFTFDRGIPVIRGIITGVLTEEITDKTGHPWGLFQVTGFTLAVSIKYVVERAREMGMEIISRRY